MEDFPVIAYRFAQNGAAMYVSHLPGDGGVDWGYTDKAEGRNGLDKALPLSKYHWQRFAKMCRDTGQCAFAVPAHT